MGESLLNLYYAHVDQGGTGFASGYCLPANDFQRVTFSYFLPPDQFASQRGFFIPNHVFQDALELPN